MVFPPALYLYIKQPKSPTGGDMVCNEMHRYQKTTKI